MSRINFDAEPLVLPLLSNVDRFSLPVILTATKLAAAQRPAGFSNTVLRTALGICKVAHGEGRRDRPWIFFFGREAHYDAIEFHAELQSGVAVLVRAMPRTWARYRPSMHFDIPAKKQTPKEDFGPRPPAAPQPSEHEATALNSEQRGEFAQQGAGAGLRAESLPNSRYPFARPTC